MGASPINGWKIKEDTVSIFGSGPSVLDRDLSFLKDISYCLFINDLSIFKPHGRVYIDKNIYSMFCGENGVQRICMLECTPFSSHKQIGREADYVFPKTSYNGYTGLIAINLVNDLFPDKKINLFGYDFSGGELETREKKTNKYDSFLTTLKRQINSLPKKIKDKTTNFSDSKIFGIENKSIDFLLKS